MIRVKPDFLWPWIADIDAKQRIRQKIGLIEMIVTAVYGSLPIGNRKKIKKVC